MFWEIHRPLVLGFALSEVVQALVSHEAMAVWALAPDCLPLPD